MKRKYYLIIFSFFLLFLFVPKDCFALANRLSGRILLSVEENGEAWYVYPENNRRYFLGRPNDAFNIMRELGLGISQANWQKIPELGDDEKKGIDLELSKRLAGRIILQVEENGEAWYINPVNLKKYYLGRPNDAFNIMRELGLGISQENLAMIHKPGLYESINSYSFYEHRKIKVQDKNYSLDIIEIDLKNPNLEILTLTANTNQAKSLANYVFSNKAFAGLVGSYFCTAPSCGGVNYYFFPVYDSLKQKFINEDQLKYWTTGPLIAFDVNNRFYYFNDSREFKSQEYFESHYNTKLQALIANRPRILENGYNVLIDWDLDFTQTDSRHRRNAIGYIEDINNPGKGKLYLISLTSASLDELSKIMQYLEFDYALNIDGGHSSALIYNGEYMVKPGRDIPNALVFRD
jgi:hypothetical protein